MKNKKKIVALIILFGFAFFLFIPRTIILAPARELIITNLDEEPIQNAIVKQVWHQYSIRVNGQEDFLSGPNGQVSLPARIVKTRNFDLLKGCVLNIKNYFIHASCCTSESIGVLSEGYENDWFYDGEGLDSGIVTMRPGKNQQFK